MTTLSEPRQTRLIPDDYARAPGALAPLLDVRFTRFITVKIVQVLYVVGVAVIGLYTLGGVVMSFSAGFGTGVLGLILAPVVFLLSVLVLRVYLEVVAVLFRIAENTTRLADAAERSAGV